MEDIEVPAGGDEGDPVSPEPEVPSAVEEAAASDGDAQADETSDESEKEEDGAEEAAPESGHGGAFDKLLAKYGGNKDKMADAYFEQANSNSRLWEKLQGIEEYIKGQQRTEVDETKLVAEDPDVKDIVKAHNDTQSEIQATTKRQDQLISQYGVLERKIENLRGKLEVVVDYEVKAEVRDKLNEAVGDQKSVQSGIEASQRDVKRLSAELERLKRDYRKAEATAKENVSRQRQAEWERQQEAQATRREFADAMRGEAGRYGIPAESKQYAVLFQSINDRIYSYLSRLPEGSPGVDIPGAVKALMSEYADTMGLKPNAKFQKASEVKRATTPAGKSVPTAAAKVKGDAPPKDGRWTKAYVDDRARRLLGG